MAVGRDADGKSSEKAAGNLRPYVEWPQETFPDPPFTLGMANNDCCFEAHGFRLPEKPFSLDDQDNPLATLCKRYLNDPLAGRNPPVNFIPISPWVLLIVSRYKHTGRKLMTCEDMHAHPPSIPYLELSVAFLVADENVPARSFWFMPLVYIAPYQDENDTISTPPRENDASILPTMVGREVYGLPKGPARIVYDPEGLDVRHARLDILGPGRGDELAFAKACEIARTGRSPGPTPTPRQPLSIQDILTDFLPDPQWSVALHSSNILVATISPTGAGPLQVAFDKSLHLGAPLLALKQVRHPKYVDKASYQAVIGTPLDVGDEEPYTAVKSDHAIKFWDPGKQRIWTTLGLGGPQLVRQPHAFEVRTWLEFASPDRVVVLEP
jgi:hypothetical protein